MTNEVHYRNPKTGQERMLPEGLGETMGFERVASYSPPELDKPEDAVWSNQDELIGEPLKDAVAVIVARMSDDTDLTDDEHAQMDILTQTMVERYGLDIAEHPGYKDGPDGLEKLTGTHAIDTSSVTSLIDSRIEFIQALEGKIDADDAISVKAKKAIKSHLSNLLTGRTTSDESSTPVDQSSSTTTNPQIQSQPGHSDGDPH